MHLVERKLLAGVVYDFLSFMRDLGKRESLTETQLEDAKKMVKWSNTQNKEHSIAIKPSDKDGKKIWLHRRSDPFKHDFLDLEVFYT